MSALDFSEALLAAGFTSIEQLHESERWQLWKAKEHRTFAETEVNILFLNSRATWNISQDVSRTIERLLPGPRPYYAVVRPSADIANDLERVAQEFRAVSAVSVRELLRTGLAWRLRADSSSFSLDHPFVDPTVEVRETKRTRRALGFIRDWLEQDSGTGPRLGALLAPAGVGKTTLAKQITIDLHTKHFPRRIPVFITSDQWTRLPQGTDLSIWDIWREAIDSMYSAVIGTDEFDLYVESGLVIPIFDGFDELCTRYGGFFRPSEVLEQLLTLLEGTDGRILLTTRDGFWAEHIPQDRRTADVEEFVLRPFTEVERTEYLSKRFPKDDFKRAAATQVLSRLATASAQHAAAAGAGEALTTLPLVIAMAAESVDTSQPEVAIGKYGSILEGDDPLRGVLLMFMAREQKRQLLPIEPEDQFLLFRSLAFEVGPLFSHEDLRLFATSMSGIGEADPEHMALRSHGILRRVGNELSFRYDFVSDYFVAQELVERILRNPADIKLREQLIRHSHGSSPVLERAAQGLLMATPVDWANALARAWRTFADTASPGARSALLHLVIAVLNRARPNDSRRQRTDVLRSIVARGDTLELTNLYIEGTLSSLDLSDLAVVNSRFIGAGFSGVIFNAKTRFLGCSFQRGLEIDNCEGFHLATFDQSCRIDVVAKDEIRARQSVGNRLTVTKDEIAATVRLALEKFRGSIGFRTMKSTGRLRGAIVKSPIVNDVWSALESRGVVESFALHGQGRHGGLKIADDARLDVHNFLANAIVTGKVKSILESLEDAHVGKSERMP